MNPMTASGRLRILAPNTSVLDASGRAGRFDGDDSQQASRSRWYSPWRCLRSAA